jgi:hypothetical protein
MPTAVVIDSDGRVAVGTGNPSDVVIGIPGIQGIPGPPGTPGVQNLTVGPTPPSNPIPFFSVWVDTNS